MIINNRVIERFNPCKERFDDYLKYNGSNSFGFDEFLNLSNITYYDKIWVATKLLNKNQLVHFGLLCAESVLFIYEEKYPLDKRVRDCIETLKGIKDFSNMTSDEKNATTVAYAYANAAANANAAAYTANAAANAAAYAAAYTAAAVNAAANAAAYTAYAKAAANAAYTAHSCEARTQQQKLNLEYLKMAATL